MTADARVHFPLPSCMTYTDSPPEAAKTAAVLNGITAAAKHSVKRTLVNFFIIGTYLQTKLKTCFNLCRTRENAVFRKTGAKCSFPSSVCITMRIRVSDNVNILFYFPLSVNISLETGSFILQFIPFISYFFFLYKGSFHRFSMFPDFSGFFISSIDEMYIFSSII